MEQRFPNRRDGETSVHGNPRPIAGSTPGNCRILFMLLASNTLRGLFILLSVASSQTCKNVGTTTTIGTQVSFFMEAAAHLLPRVPAPHEHGQDPVAVRPHRSGCD